MTEEKYKTLLEDAPDHNSKEFLIYLMNNNTVMADLNHWLIIENCKYHTPDRKWYTAFNKNKELIYGNDKIELIDWLEDGMVLFRNPESERSIDRNHYHITPRNVLSKEL